MNTNAVRVLGAEDVRALLSWPELIAATSEALVAIALPGGAVKGSSSQVAVPGGALHLKAGALLEPPVLSVKANLRPDVGSSSGAILVFDHRAQRLQAVLSSGDLTATRTGAIAAVAARALLRISDPAIALVGSGPVARQACRALRHVLTPSAVRVWSRDTERARLLVQQEAAADGAVCESVAETVRGADLIITCTPSRAPLLERADLADGSVILAMGADSPGKRELAPAILDHAQLFVDVLDDALAVGECAHLVGRRGDVIELGAILGSHRTASTQPLTVFDSVGSAAVDAAATALVIQRAESLGVGSFIILSPEPG